MCRIPVGRCSVLFLFFSLNHLERGSVESSEVVSRCNTLSRSVEGVLELPKSCRLESIFVRAVVVCSGPEQQSGWAHNCRQSVREGEVGEQEASLACRSQHVIIVLSEEVRVAELTLVIEQKVSRVVQSLEKLSAGIVVSRDLVLLAVETETNFLASKVVMNFLETLAGLNIRKLFATLVIVEVHDELGKVVGSLHFRVNLLLHVGFDKALDALLVLRHF